MTDPPLHLCTDDQMVGLAATVTIAAVLACLILFYLTGVVLAILQEPKP